MIWLEIAAQALNIFFGKKCPTIFREHEFSPGAHPTMNQIPVPRSKSQIMGDMLDVFTSRSGISKVKIGNPILSILEAASQSDLRSSQDIFDLLRSGTLDDATGMALDRKGQDEGVPRIFEGPAVGVVTVSDSTFTKVSTKIYQGLPAPLLGTTTINVADASDAAGWSNSGSVYLGRGTPNYEGPLSFNARVNNGAYWTLTLTSPTTKYHNVGESVILAQGGLRNIPAGAIVQTPQGSVSNAVQFSVLYPAAIPDGETSVTGVTVIATKNGLVGNVAANSIKSFVSAPFSGATVTNPLPFTNATATEDNDTYRERIRSARASRSKAIPIAIQNAVQGVRAADENRRVASSSLVTRQGYPTTLYIDDGTGYEESSVGVPFESLNDFAFGGEQYLQVSERPITKAFLQTTLSAPFALAAGMSLSVNVGGVTTVHTFNTTDARSIGAASAYEVVASINANPNLLWGARTAGSGTQVVISAKADTGEDIQIVSVENDANKFLGFPSTKALTMRLYRNDRLLSKDGKPASIASVPFGSWGAISGSQTLQINVDGTGAVTYTFTDQDFIDAATGFVSVELNSLAAWAAVFNKRIPGTTTTVSPTGLLIRSNLCNNSRASLSITGGTLAGAANMWVVSSATGASPDFVLDRNTGQIQTSVVAAPGDRITIGSSWTRAFLETPAISPTSLTSQGNLWFSVDGAATLVPTALTSSSSLTISVSRTHRWGYRLRITSTAGDYTNVRVGDQVTFWDPDLRASGLQNGVWYVAAVDSAFAWFEIEKPSLNYHRNRATATLLANGNILVAGGFTGWGNIAPTASAILYDPATGAVQPVQDMNQRRAGHTATLLDNGKVFVFGGVTGPNETYATNTGEIFDPATNLWTAVSTTGAPPARSLHLAVLTAGNLVLISGGRDVAGAPLATCFLYDRSADTWAATGAMAAARYNHAGGLLTSNSRIAIAGGENATVALATAELYDEGAGTWSNIGSLAGVRSGLRCVALAANKLLFAGGSNVKEASSTTSTVQATADTYTAGAGAPAATGALNVACAFQVMAKLTNGNVVSAFGLRAAGAMVELFDGATWATRNNPGNTTYARIHSCAALAGAASNSLVIFGGRENNSSASPVAAVEVHDGAGNSWSTPDPAVGAWAITSTGVTFARASDLLQRVSIAKGTSYTASSFVSSISSVWSTAGEGTVSATTGSTAVTGVGSSFLSWSIGDQISFDAGVSWYDVADISSDTSLTLSTPSASTVAGASWLVRSGFKQLQGAFSSVTQTNKIRVSTASFAQPGGDIALVTGDVEGRKLALPVSSAVSNITGHIASVESGNSEIGTPSPLALAITGSTGFRKLLASQSNFVSALSTPWNAHSGHTLTVGRSAADAYTGTVYQRFGSNKGFACSLASVVKNPDHLVVQLNDRPNSPLVPGDRLIFCEPFAIAPDDTLAFVVDGDTESKRYLPNMYRRVKPTSTTYGVTNSFSDSETGGTTGASFGLAYDFSDFAAYMRARAKTHDGNLAGYANFNKTILWRWWRHGSEGNAADLRYVLPTGPSLPVSVSVDNTTNSKSSVSISLASGALRTGYSIRGTTKIGTATTGAAVNGMQGVVFILGFAVSSVTRAANVTTLTLTLPSGVTDHGLQIGNQIYLKTSDVNLTQAAYTITAVTPTTISFADVAANFGPVAPAAGTTVSFDSQEATLDGGGVIVGDFFRIGATSGVEAGYKGATIRITSTGPQFIAGRIPSFSGVTHTTAIWSTLNDVTLFQAFQNPAQAASVINTAVNALYTAGTSPVQGTLIGDGSGTIDRATGEETDDGVNLNGATYAYSLSDGLNWVRSSVAPGGVGSNYQLTFKNPIDNANNATNSDWINEDVRIVPVTAANVVRWLLTPTISGAFSVASIQTSSRSRKVQISSLALGSAGSVQVQGGTANSVSVPVVGSATATGSDNMCVATINTSNVVGLTGRMWVAVQNANALPKGTGIAGQVGITPNTALTSIATNGTFTLAGEKIWDTAAAPSANVMVQVERQGRLVAFRDTGLGSALTLSGVSEGDWVYITAPAAPTGGNTPAIASANTGTYRVVRTVANLDGGAGTFWIESTSAIEDQAAECDIKFLKYDSIMPGDILNITTSIWGANNQGTWTVKTVGASGGVNFAGSNYVFTVDVTKNHIHVQGAVAALGTGYNAVKVIEGTPSRLLKQIHSLSTTAVAGLTAVKFNSSAGVSRISQAAGSVLGALDKLAFPTTLSVGVDGYKHSVGLIGEVTRVIYGDPRDPATYPGVVAAGATVNVSGPNVRRLSVALQLRVKSGAATTDIAASVRSAVAAVINRTGVGQPIALGALVAACQKVSGVVSAVITAPTYNSSNDLIPLQPFEKAFVLNLDTDITVSFLGV